jgi:hypothetical protein
MSQITFKQYLDSKDKLREAVKNTPQRTVEYTVRKYSKLAIGENKESKQYVPVKPKHKIIVEWLYDDVDNPTPVSLRFEGIDNVDAQSEHLTFWSGSKLVKWLYRNAREETAV